MNKIQSAQAINENQIDKSEASVIGAVANLILQDIANSSEQRVNLAKQIGYDEGFRAGFNKGYLKAQADIRNAMQAVELATGKIKVDLGD